MIHNNFNKITRNFDHRSGVITNSNKAGSYKLNVGYHLYNNAYNFLANPPVGSVGVVKPVQAKSNPVVWTPDTNDKRGVKESTIDNQISTPDYISDTNLVTLTPFGTPPYYNSYQTFNVVDFYCPSPIYLNLTSQKKIPVAMKIENVSGNFSTAWIYLGWNESKRIENKTYTVYKYYFSYGYAPVNSPYFMYIPWTWSIMWGGCASDCANENAWKILAFKESASTFELIKRAKTGGAIGIHFMLTAGLDSVCGNYYYKSCAYPVPYGCCECGSAKITAKITVYYQNNYPDWDKV